MRDSDSHGLNNDRRMEFSIWEANSAEKLERMTERASERASEQERERRESERARIRLLPSFETALTEPHAH